MKKILVVVDVQKDFYHPDGSLYVKGAEELPSKIASSIDKFDDVIFTMDWHPYNHCSFNENNGQWPTHCVAFTEGASLPQEFSKYINNIHAGQCDNVIEKGCNCDTEEYGANPVSIMLGHNENPEDCEFIFCGIAGDFCVKHTLSNFISAYKNKCYVCLDLTASIDDGTTIKNFMIDNEIEEYKL